MMMASHISDGGCGPGLHYHHSDQLYYLIRGNMTIQLGSEVDKIGPGTFVFIPAGLAHCNWNEGPGSETHLEMMIPAPMPGSQIVFLVDSPDRVPPGESTDRNGYVCQIDPQLCSEPMPGFRVHSLATPETGATGTVVNYAELDPGGGGPGTHFHEYDFYILVLEGELTVEIALEKHRVSPETLVVLPAGVPHRQYNEGDVPEKHLEVLTPPPVKGQPWARGVIFSANDADQTGVTTSPTQP